MHAFFFVANIVVGVSGEWCYKRSLVVIAWGWKQRALVGM
jgi:hypothetical protein